jgi:dTMP kinase
LITLSGFDGTGKTTQIAALREHFEGLGRRVVCTRQPTDHYRSLPLMREFTDGGGGAEAARVLALLAAADRYRHVMEVIRPELERGSTVLCDRYVYDFFAVFTHRGVPFELLTAVSAQTPRPDHAFHLRLGAAETLRRLGSRGHAARRYEERSVERVEQILDRYQALAPLMTAVAASGPEHEVTGAILASIAPETRSSPGPPRRP